MSNTSYFANAQGTAIGSHANFQTVRRGAITNNYYQYTHGEDRLDVGSGKTVRRIHESDVNFQRILSSEILTVSIGTGEQGSTSNELEAVRVRKTVQTAEIFQCPGTFTTTTLEPVDVRDREKVNMIARRTLEAGMCRRSARLIQLFGVVDSDPLTLVTYNELASGDEVALRYREKNRIVYYYLAYTHSLAMQSLRDDETATFLVTNRWSDWSLDVKTLAWRYDPASISLSPPSEQDLKPYYDRYAPLRQETLRQLDANKIITCVEEGLGDCLVLVAPYGEGRFTDLSNYARHGLLTFGTVVDKHKPRILAHFPSAPFPSEWFCYSYNLDLKASFSKSAPWRVDFSFPKTGHIRVRIGFVLRIPKKDGVKFRAAHLCQFFSSVNECEDVRDVVYIDQVGFTLEGTVHDDPTTRPTPVFLFFPPLPIERIHNMHCMRYPLSESLFYWSFDRQGQRRISEDRWEEFNIPRLELKTWIRSYWNGGDYSFVRDVLSSRNYNFDGGRYAREHGYPDLIHSDPHDNKKSEKLRESELAGTPSQLTSPSAFSLVEAEPEAVSAPTVAASLTGWAKGFLNKAYKGKARASSSSAPREGEWDLISREETV